MVADSDPDSEWEETLSKAKALIRALQMAQNKLMID
ncbi:MAG: anthranilate/para-aminobenzoate synthase component I [Pseudohongiellaceae bacterium]